MEKNFIYRLILIISVSIVFYLLDVESKLLFLLVVIVLDLTGCTILNFLNTRYKCKEYEYRRSDTIIELIASVIFGGEILL